MNFKETEIQGLYLVDLQQISDDRGFFARAFCKEEFAEIGLESEVLQANMSFSKNAGTLRGMHYQKNPYQETKLIRCIRGSIYDVVIDLRKDSPSYGDWYGVELNDKNRTALMVPKDFAHGFITLQDDTEVMYLVSQSYVPGAEMGIRWNDPRFAISWPVEPTVISSKDAELVNFND
ncbi:MAG: dTDP-4-dehydrorhamnose 3,5-epimerase [Porticoccaceae bacterium]|nr:dTDP-4-dehydrorhamnose 3,5-epimerase [Porticoccaceae bacterium]